MAHYGLLGDFEFDDASAAEDIRGANIYGRDDEKLGKIEDVIFDHSTGSIRYVVVEAGGWFSTKKFLAPVHRLHSSANHESDFSVNLTKEQIEAFPAYNEPDVESEGKWDAYQKQYDSAWQSGPVQHREDTDRNVTPTATEMPAESGSIGSQLTPSQRAELNSRIIPPGGNDLTIDTGGTGIGSRWLSFEDRLRQRRRDITQGCTTCTAGSASRQPESATEVRKAS
jgi:hypothetical protein